MEHLGLTVFHCSYLDVVRKLQHIYRMEPAGSHGAWSLDDHQFVPFIWGSSQLIGTEVNYFENKKVKECMYVHYI